MPEPVHRDPICGKELSTNVPVLSLVHSSETWLFCSRLCQIVFEAFPDLSVEIARGERAALLEIEHPPHQMQHESRVHGPDPPGKPAEPDGTADAIDRTQAEDVLRHPVREATR